MRLQNRIFISAYAAILFAALLQTGSAQNLGFNGRLTGMGNGAAALVRGTDALGTNPALIAPPTGSHASISVIPVGFHAGTDFLDFGTYKKYFTGVEDENGNRVGYYLNQNDKDIILGSFTGDAGTFGIAGNYRLLAATFGWKGFAFGLDMTDHIGSNGSIPKPFMEFMFNGNPPGKTFDFSGLQFRSSWTRSYSLSIAQTIQVGKVNTPVSVGASVKLVHGYGYFGVERFDSRFTTDPDSFVVYGRANMLANYAGTEWLDNASIYLIQMFPNPVGSGISVDFGVHAQISPYLQVGASLTDIGSITWNRGAKKSEADEYFTINEVGTSDQTEDLKSRLNGKEAPIASFETPLPAALTLAASYSFPDILTNGKTLELAAALRQGFNGEPGNIEGTFIGVGAEYAFLDGVPLRLGASFGGYQPINMSMGIGFQLERFTLDLGTGNILSAFTDGFTSSSFAVTTHFDL